MRIKRAHRALGGEGSLMRVAHITGAEDRAHEQVKDLSTF